MILNLGAVINIILLTAAGAVAGIVVGAIPGLSGSMAISILVSLTFGWDVLPALAVMMGVYQGVCFGGSISACLINIPGAPAAVCTTLDGYPLAQRGEGGIAIGLACTESFIGGILGTLALAAFAPPLSAVALKFAPQDYFLLASFGILLVGSFSSGDLSKSILTAALGILLGLMGLDVITGLPRLCFGTTELLKGVDIVVGILGLFGLSEVFYQLSSAPERHVIQRIDRVVPPLGWVVKFLPLTLRTSAIGMLIGALPGVGGPIAAFLAYDHAKKTVKNPSRPFGQGAYEGVVAPESANNAAVGGALIPMLTLGIPGDAVTAILIGALRIHGLRPGPMLMTERPDLFWVIVVSLFFACIFFLVFGLMSIKPFARLISIPNNLLLPPIVFITVIGAYAISSSLLDVAWMFVLGLVGFWFKVYGYPISPMVLGLVLGSMIDETFRRGVIINRGDIASFLLSLVNNPISLVITAMIVVFVGLSWRHKASRTAA